MVVIRHVAVLSVLVAVSLAPSRAWRASLDDARAVIVTRAERGFSTSPSGSAWTGTGPDDGSVNALVIDPKNPWGRRLTPGGRLEGTSQHSAAGSGSPLG